MNKTFIILITLLLMGAGCATVNEYTTEETDNKTTISGIVTAGRFSGTEMACGFTEDAEIGDQLSCNSGSVNLAVVSQEDGLTVWLEEHTCHATEIYTKTIDGMDVSYETSDCTSDMVVGNDYAFEGVLEQRVDQWYRGVQQDEWWLSVEEIE